MTVVGCVVAGSVVATVDWLLSVMVGMVVTMIGSVVVVTVSVVAGKHPAETTIYYKLKRHIHLAHEKKHG
jgi:ATP/ADP translocase